MVQKCELESAISPGAYIILNAFGLFSGLDSYWFSEKYACMHQEKINYYVLYDDNRHMIGIPVFSVLKIR